ncbi:MAG: DUF5666 domain-containing protein [candidate division KSB1 bacterium]|nr:DUF5666 domain-containing protein [candidate division KSB1 bacterium]MDZ7273231.1 DUF5666 domain-containing protein [candidate division KSB1 bacterium]MDZ7285333.1 DUF5666 domain-containing protein [candidate division KSB1 bacterium]MDZ7298365.1 DUF5666 domain-containing protein [candidate division KSB1 bacterium]MDZ7309252.1 DUF5666 domain-containing protein [candidate division KSB1 bacterium]
MPRINGLQHLKIGQRVKIKGRSEPDGTFLALDITPKPGDYEAEFEGVVQRLDPERHVLRLLNRDIAVPATALIKDVTRQETGWQAIQPGDLVKVKGTYSRAYGFLPAKLKVKERRGFAIEELQGAIQSIDPEAGTLDIIGVTVRLSEKTIFEGF